MIKKIIIIILFSSFYLHYSLLNSTTFEINQDGSANFTTIQEGIIAATDSDTILVYPGIYHENIDYLEKSLTVASLYLITPEDLLINQTIIDGNQQARCVTIDECESASLVGFTIQNGLAYICSSQNQYGGGVYIKDTSNAIISNCKIKNNKAYSGGGIHINHGNTLLESNTVSNNWGVRYGGGISIYGNDTILQFSETNLNNIYLNYSSTGSDISITEVVPPMNIFVDTLTVSEPDFFFINPSNKYTFSGLNHKIEQIDQDLYVAPDGSDNNNGLTPDNPCQTIFWAQTQIKRNDENPNTIHLASGIYSPSLNFQKYPLNIKHGVKYLGVSPETTILDAEGQTPFIFFNSKEDIYVSLSLEAMTLTNSHTFDFPSGGAINILYQAELDMKDIIIKNSICDIREAISCNVGFYNFNNIVIKDNSGSAGLYLAANYQNQNPLLDVTIKNSIFKNNYPNFIDPDFPGGGALKIFGHSGIPGEYNAKLINCDITGNHSAFYYDGIAGTAGLYSKDIIIDLINCTWGENIVDYDTGCVITANNSQVNLYNNIIYNNDGHSFNFWDDGEVNIYHSLIEDNTSNIGYYGNGNGILNWMDGNIDTNPLWVGEGDYPFSLSELSPCIDTGTLDLPEGIELPEFDLAGNFRIVNGLVDIGAYEYPDTISVSEEIIKPIIQTKITNYPNPFNPTTTINLELAESGKIELAIFNIKGQKIKTLMNAYSTKGAFEFNWQGKDNNKKQVSSGSYFIKLKVDGVEKAVRKCVLLK